MLKTTLSIATLIILGSTLSSCSEAETGGDKPMSYFWKDEAKNAKRNEAVAAATSADDLRKAGVLTKDQAKYIDELPDDDRTDALVSLKSDVDTRIAIDQRIVGDRAAVLRESKVEGTWTAITLMEKTGEKWVKSTQPGQTEFLHLTMPGAYASFVVTGAQEITIESALIEPTIYYGEEEEVPYFVLHDLMGKALSGAKHIPQVEIMLPPCIDLGTHDLDTRIGRFREGGDDFVSLKSYDGSPTGNIKINKIENGHLFGFFELTVANGDDPTRTVTVQGGIQNVKGYCPSQTD